MILSPLFLSEPVYDFDEYFVRPKGLFNYQSRFTASTSTLLRPKGLLNDLSRCAASMVILLRPKGVKAEEPVYIRKELR